MHLAANEAVMLKGRNSGEAESHFGKKIVIKDICDGVTSAQTLE